MTVLEHDDDQGNPRVEEGRERRPMPAAYQGEDRDINERYLAQEIARREPTQSAASHAARHYARHDTTTGVDRRDTRGNGQG